MKLPPVKVIFGDQTHEADQVTSKPVTQDNQGVCLELRSKTSTTVLFSGVATVDHGSGVKTYDLGFSEASSAVNQPSFMRRVASRMSKF